MNYRTLYVDLHSSSSHATSDLQPPYAFPEQQSHQELHLEISLGAQGMKTLHRPCEEVVAKTLERIRLLFHDGSKGIRKVNQTSSLQGKGKKVREPARNSSPSSCGDNRNTNKKKTQRHIEGKNDKALRLASCPPALLLASDGNSVLSSEIGNQEALSEGTILQVGEYRWRIRRDVPCLRSFTVPPKLMVGCPCVPLIMDCLHAPNPQKNFLWRWRCLEHRDDPPSTLDILPKTNIVEKRKGSRSDADAPGILSFDMVFVPTIPCLGKRLEVSVEDPRGHILSNITSVVCPGPKAARLPCPLHPVTSESLSTATAPRFRAVSYNLLHDAYATSDYARRCLYPHVALENIEYQNRELRLGLELMRYESDLLALQEISRVGYHTFFYPLCRNMEFEGIHESKMLPQHFHDSVHKPSQRAMDDGCCLLWNKKKFQYLAHRTLPLTMEFFSTCAYAQVECLKLLHQKIQNYPRVREALENVTTRALLLVLKTIPPSKLEKGKIFARAAQGSGRNPTSELIVANTHLFWHPHAKHIRVLQAYMLRHALSCLWKERIREAQVQGTAIPRLGVLLCGDLNSLPHGMTYDLLQKGQVNSCDPEWNDSLVFNWGATRDKILGIPATKTKNNGREEASGVQTPLTSPMNLNMEKNNKARFQLDLSADISFSLNDCCPHWGDTTFTNYTPDFKARLDYIFASPSALRCIHILDNPPEKELSCQKGIPNDQFPSDHVAVVADFEWCHSSTS